MKTHKGYDADESWGHPLTLVQPLTIEERMRTIGTGDRVLLPLHKCDDTGEHCNGNRADYLRDNGWSTKEIIHLYQKEGRL